MTFLEQIQSHKGGLLRLKTRLYWYGSGYDKNPGRICLILDTAATANTANRAAATVAVVAGSRTAVVAEHAALLLLDGSPRWVWIAEDDVEIL
jgi:hypothetical protein